jgi:hypothetical protein
LGGVFRSIRKWQCRVRPHPGDRHPSPLLGNLPAIADSPARIRRPAIRRGWLEGRPGHAHKRGADDYLEVNWPDTEDLVAKELRRVYDDFGPRAVFGGSYGWSSAGRFHHAQSQIHRFLNVLGGYVPSVNTYAGAAMVIIPHVLGPYDQFDRKSITEFHYHSQALRYTSSIGQAETRFITIRISTGCERPSDGWKRSSCTRRLDFDRPSCGHRFTCNHHTRT